MLQYMRRGRWICYLRARLIGLARAAVFCPPVTMTRFPGKHTCLRAWLPGESAARLKARLERRAQQSASWLGASLLTERAEETHPLRGERLQTSWSKSWRPSRSRLVRPCSSLPTITLQPQIDPPL